METKTPLPTPTVQPVINLQCPSSPPPILPIHWPVPQWQGFRGSKSLSLPMRNNQLPALFNGVMVYHFMCHRALYRDGTPWAVWSPCLSLAHILGCFATCWLPLINPLPDDSAWTTAHLLQESWLSIQASQRGPKHSLQPETWRDTTAVRESVWVETSDVVNAVTPAAFGEYILQHHNHFRGSIHYKDWKQGALLHSSA